MASGKTHDEIAVASGPLLGLVAFAVCRNLEASVAIGLGCLMGGYWLSPDLDTRSRPYQRWGPLRWIWLPYQKTFRHRSPWSHGPLVGTTVRVLYVAAWGLLGAIALLGLVAIATHLAGASQQYRQFEQDSVRQMAAGAAQLWAEKGAIAGLFFVGLEIGALGHLLADWVASARRPGRRKPRRRAAKPRPRTPPSPNQRTQSATQPRTQSRTQPRTQPRTKLKANR